MNRQPVVSSLPRAATPRPPRSPWIIGSRADSLLFLGTPVLLFVIAELAMRLGFEAGILAAGTIGTVGHHFPGLIRAYGEPALFARHRYRLVFGTAILAMVASIFVFGRLEGLGFVVVMWGMWHAMAQVYGMGRSYDAKVGHLSRRTALFDKGLCISWFAAIFLFSPSRLRIALTEIYKAGLPAVHAEVISYLQMAAVVVTSTVTVAWLLHSVSSHRSGRRESIRKVGFFAGSLGFWWYANVPVQNLVIGVALFELLHDLHYLGFVWNFKNSELNRDPSPPRFAVALFNPTFRNAALFVCLTVAYGALLRGVELSASGVFLQIVSVLILVSTFVHFYTDGFIWNLRDASVREILGIDEAPRA